MTRGAPLGSAPPHDKIAFFWHQFGSYHMDRCSAVAASLGGSNVVGLELASSSHTYAWAPSGAATDFQKVTLFPDRKAEDLKTLPRLVAILTAIRRHRIRRLFLAGYEEPANFLVALLAPLLRCKVYVVLDSKFDDKPRRLFLETFKAFLMLPYRGGMASGARAADYLRFLGLRRRPVTLGYDAVSLERMRRLGVTSRGRDELAPLLVVARFVEKKNLALAIAAFADYNHKGGARRRLRLCGDGPLHAELIAKAVALGVRHMVDFLGFVDSDTVAREMAGAWALLLPSTEEQWGLVVNEALAFGLPVLTTSATGAIDTLITNWRNGFILPADDATAWGTALLAMDDPQRHAAFREESLRRAPLGDAAVFVTGVKQLIAAT